MVKKKSFGLILLVGMLFFLVVFVFAVTPSWQGSDVNYNGVEDTVYFHNLTLNVSGYNNDVSFTVSTTDYNITITNNSGTFNISYETVSSWLYIPSPMEGILVINSTSDNKAGFFRIPIQAKNISNNVASTTLFNFTINATNDAPLFLTLQNILNPYNTTAPISGSSFFNISFNGWDEESHYPLEIINITFFGCSKAPWTNTSNCFLNNSFSRSGNTTLIINFTNLTKENVGVYNLGVCIKDNINSTTNYPIYRTSDYNENKTSCQNFSLNVFYSLSIDASNCSGLSLVEGQNLSCYINVTTKKSSESFNIWSNAFLNFTNADLFINELTRKEWFLSLNQNNSQDFFKQVFVNITNLTKRNVGNWTINIGANLTEGNFASQNISFFVNKTNFFPVFYYNFSNENNKTAIGSFAFFNFSFYDEDFLIPDKKFYNETINLTIKVFNNSSGQEVFWQNFTNRTFVYQGNSSYSNQSLIFMPNSSQVGVWRINFSYFDREGNYGEENFFFEVLNKEPPKWNQTIVYLNCVVNSTLETTIPCLQNVNLTNPANGFVYAYDSDEDILSFSVVGNSTKNFNLSSAGILNFVPWKEDVSMYKTYSDGRINGTWDFNLSVFDGYLENRSLRVVINVSNVNSPPRINNISFPSSTEENNLTIISFRIYDDDLLIPYSYPNHNPRREDNFTLNKFSFSLSAQQNLTFSDFSDWLSHLISGGEMGDGNSFPVNFSFIPNKSHVGNHTINISVYDRFGISTLNWSVFNISVTGTNNKPQFLQNLNNISTAIGRNFYLKINATDIEDGDDFNGNLTFNYSLLSRQYFGRSSKTQRIFDCENCFNSSRGIFNLTLNQSHAGFYVINVSVTDSGFDGNEIKEKKTTSQIFWLFIYDYPEILFPQENFQFNFSENSTQLFNFSVNHTIGNNLTYLFYIDKLSCSYQNKSNCSYSSLLVRDSRNFSANGSNISWNNFFGFDEETYGNLKNLTLVVYPSDQNLENKSHLNFSRTFKLNITHVNSPPNLTKQIETKTGILGAESPIQINLSQYFFDYDNEDSFYKESLSYYMESTSSQSDIYFGSIAQGNRLPKIFSSPLALLYSQIELSEILFVVVNDSEMNSVRSNNFSVIFLPPNIQQVQTPSSGGGSSPNQITKTASLSIVVPSAVKSKMNDYLEVPVYIKNTGEVKLQNINLGSGFKQNIEQNVSIRLSSYSLGSLDVGQEKNLTAKIDINTKKAGKYLAYVNASSENPKVSQEASFYIEIETIPGVNLEEVLVFTEKILAENPECAELRERLIVVEKLKNSGDYERAANLAKEIVESCKKTISQKRNFILFQREVPKSFFLLFLSLVVLFIFFVIFYIYKRVRFNKAIREEYT